MMIIGHLFHPLRLQYLKIRIKILKLSHLHVVVVVDVGTTTLKRIIEMIVEKVEFQKKINIQSTRMMLSVSATLL